MGNSIDKIKHTHEKLYKKVFEDYLIIKDTSSEESKKYVKQIEDLLGEISGLSDTEISIDDYDWLNDAAMKWQVVFSSILNIPKNVQISPPKHHLKSLLPKMFFSEEELGKRLTGRAFKFAKDRIKKEDLDTLVRRYLSSQDEMDRDRHNAEVSLAAEIIDEEINFAYDIDQESYKHLENIWLKDVKEYKAYFVWKERCGKGIERNEKDYYYNACKAIREKLVDVDIKVPLSYFYEVKDYLETRYLINEKIDPKRAEELIRKKADRIWQTTNGRFDKEINWHLAEAYVRMLYENIIPAVIEKDECKTLMVLRAFQYSKAPENRYLIINCFETAIAICFLDQDIIQNLWKSKRDLCGFSMVYVKDWPEDIDSSICEKRFRFDSKEQQIICEGEMTEEEKNSLIDQLSRDDHKKAVAALFYQSRLDPKEITL